MITIPKNEVIVKIIVFQLILSPSALVFLLFIGVPIFIHILNRFYVKKVNFSTIRFIKSLKNNALKKLKFKKMMLLLIRIGIISIAEQRECINPSSPRVFFIRPIVQGGSF